LALFIIYRFAVKKLKDNQRRVADHGPGPFEGLTSTLSLLVAADFPIRISAAAATPPALTAVTVRSARMSGGGENIDSDFRA